MLDFDIPTFIFSIINLAVIYVILKKFLFTPIMRHMEKRKNAIVEALDNARTKEEKADGMIREYEEKIRQTDQYADKMYKEAADKGRAEYEAMIRDAKKAAADIIRKSEQEAEKMKEALAEEVKDHVARLSIIIAAKLLKENMDTEKNRVLVKQFLSDEDTAI